VNLCFSFPQAWGCRLGIALLAGALCCGSAGLGWGQELLTYQGDPIPAELDAMYVKGLDYLVRTQKEDGGWDGQYGNEAGVVGLAVLAMLARGDDPNFGRYNGAIRKALNLILRAANSANGYIGSSMYNHGFAALALAEAYGAVDDERLGPALKKAVDLILSTQARNNYGAWRYSPESTDADTTVSGAQLVALLAARNAGIAVPDKAISTALKYFSQCQLGDGGFGYTGADSTSGPRAAIGVLVFALARQKNSAEFKSGFKYLSQSGYADDSFPFYYHYYASQAFFHGDRESWTRWNKENISNMAALQEADGGWKGQNVGATFATSAALLSLALNYRFLPIYER
jgi:hypothetical protein